MSADVYPVALPAVQWELLLEFIESASAHVNDCMLPDCRTCERLMHIAQAILDVLPADIED